VAIIWRMSEGNSGNRLTWRFSFYAECYGTIYQMLSLGDYQMHTNVYYRREKNSIDNEKCSNRSSCCLKVRIMKRVLNEDLIYEILSVVEEIPEGYVATYGQIAKLIGRDKNARLVGKVLSMAGYYGEYPCHRVVNHYGRLVPGWTEQKYLLLQEGVFIKDDGHVDMKRHKWDFHSI